MRSKLGGGSYKDPDLKENKKLILTDVGYGKGLS